MIKARRHPPAARVKRQQVGPQPQLVSIPGGPVISGPLTGPIVVTVRSTLAPVPTINSVFRPSVTTTTSRSSSVAQAVVTTSSSSTSTSNPATTPSPPPSTSTPIVSPINQPGADNSSNKPSNDNNNNSSKDDTSGTAPPSGSTSISGGAIAGIVVAIILLLIILAFFLFRRRLTQRRQANRTNAPWLSKGGIEGGANGIVNSGLGAGGGPSYSFDNNMVYGEKSIVQTTTTTVGGGGAQDLPPLQPLRGPFAYPYDTTGTGGVSSVPASIYIDTPISPRTVVTSTSSMITTAAPAAPLPIPQPQPPIITQTGPGPGSGPFSSPSSTSSTSKGGPLSSLVTVRCTFDPTLPDELRISPGETLRVLAEYDDGWSSCLKVSTGEEGMVPIECYDDAARAGTPGIVGVVGRFEEGDASRRASSLGGNGEGINGRIWV